ncbi:MAG: prefoldin subunit alpha [Candidatus Bathyarchaeota archaeon]|nr:MAG: prefoldin subunit alpha [Candidatus Bathyarchaeota archaeon]
MSSDEEIFRRLAVELRILEGTAEALQSRINFIRAALTELRVASLTLQGVEKEKKNIPLFVPIGGGSYIKAKLASAEKIIVGIGADVAIERTMKEARINFENRIAEFEKTGNSLGQQLNEVITKMQDHRVELEEVTAKLRQREKTRRVRKA